MKKSRTIRDFYHPGEVDSVEISLKIIMVLALVLIITLSTIAQTGSLKVMVADKETKEDVSFATVVIWTDSTNVISQLSDENGEIVFTNLTPGKYKVQAKTLGYHCNEIKKANVTADHESEQRVLLTHKARLNQILTVTTRLVDLFK